MNAACPYTLYLGRLAPSSQRSIASQLNNIAELLGWSKQDRKAMFHQIDYRQASQLKALLLEQGWSARSVNRAMAAIRNIVKMAVMVGLAPEMQSLQLQSITKVTHGSHKGSPLDIKQVEALFCELNKNKTVTGKRDYAIVAFLLGTGLRRSELIALQHLDYSFEASTIHVQKGKGNKSRTIFLPNWTTEALEQWLEHRGTADGPLFLRIARGGHVQHGSQLSSSFVYFLIRKTLSSIGIDGVSPHDLRRTFITRLLEQNIDLNTVRQMAGHANIATTIMYDKRGDRAMRLAAANLIYSNKEKLHGK